ncbi:MAG: hypothetical protein ED559_05115 [Phycisphaera sp.]|nr:MAG: hypothetical protein ED559_05115 [Phycisphaera sp.]
MWLATVTIGVAGALLIAVTAVWAFQPLNTDQIDTEWAPQTNDPTITEPQSKTHYQLSAFDKRLWTPPAVEETEQRAETTEPPPPPLPKLQLVGIVTPEEGVSDRCLAILYNPDTDTTHILGEGETIGGLSIGNVTPTSAGLITPQGETEIILDTGKSEETKG